MVGISSFQSTALQTANDAKAAPATDTPNKPGLSAGRVVKQIVDLTAHAAVLLGKGLYKLGEGTVWAAKKFGQLIQGAYHAYQAQNQRSERLLKQRQAQVLKTSPTAVSPRKPASAAAPLQPASKIPLSNAERLERKQIQQIRRAPEPPRTPPGHKSAGAYSNFEHNGSNLSGKPLSPQEAKEIAALEKRLAALRRDDA